MAIARIGRGRNSVRLRRYNERLLLQVLRRSGEASKADLARRTHLTSTAIGGIIQSLEESELIVYTGRRTEGQRGQPATLIDLNPKGAFGIGVRLDRDSIETALLDFGGQILARRVHEGTLPSPDETLQLVLDDIEEVLKAITPDEQERLAGIGVAQPFNLGAWLRELNLVNPDFRAWDDVDFAFELGEATGLPVFSENDGNAAAIAELFYGCGREFDDFIYIFMGPVIGCGVALNGDCLRGVTGNAGDIAVMPVPPSRLASAQAPKGKWDLLLSRASLNALGRHLRHSGVEVSCHADLERHIRAHHPAVEEWVEDCIDALTPAVRSALCMLDVPVVVFDADVDAGLVDLLRKRLAQSLADTAPEARGVPELVRGSFGSDAGAIGAASLPMFFSFSPRAELLGGGAKSTEEMRDGE
ncbi:MAG TPA: ROK family transcriptional regulator [Aromatoleum sp.]|uniref:ROK family transcriptional regulator n=1 Tax=Aromatoleum sp. TaxID=2307007 RepID=UPI002B48E5AD|nr:ROK family transcriptional regulator [Aromatoleum sp.]HJV24723.1 ROK family transcriptional regulator [Aromatoleum sp.]